MSQSDAGRPEAVLLGCGMIIASVLMLSLGDALVKWVSADLPLWQLFVVRSLLAMPLCLALLRIGAQPLAVTPGNAGWVFLRTLLLVMMWIAFYVALPALSLPVAAAALYTAPLFVTLFSSLLIGEAVGLRRGSAIVLGFIGVLFVVRPEGDSFSYAALLPVLSAAFYALAMIITRGKCGAENPLVLAFCLCALLFVFGVAGSGTVILLGLDPAGAAANPFLLSPWAPMDGMTWALVAALAVLLVAASAAAAKAYQSAPPAIVAAFDYSYLLFALFWGVVFFSERPDGPTLAGMIMITVAGLLVIGRRWQKRVRQKGHALR